MAPTNKYTHVQNRNSHYVIPGATTMGTAMTMGTVMTTAMVITMAMTMDGTVVGTITVEEEAEEDVIGTVGCTAIITSGRRSIVG
ncbi:hypothetical protein ANCCEY_10243 [Ancylostoma ceylanicum]|uniref:Uncharacterized protein n=1 Tax=Ancylostoma ceylanicum TaxID=53326 RepID=A0A0D6LEZ6_9BILA|nr:hypothetical protein ANCCEY_10243 [Ancylostoma ceylanicum]